MPRVLLVEDEIGAIAALKRALVRGGFEVAIATNVADALSSAENGRPDAVLISRGLQGGNTGDLPEALRALDPDRPLVILGDGDGFEGPTLPRPVDGGRLVELLRKVLGEEAPDEGEPAIQPPALAELEAIREPLPEMLSAAAPEPFTPLPDDPEPIPEPRAAPRPEPPAEAALEPPAEPKPPTPPVLTTEERRRQLMARVEALRAATRSAPLRGSPATRAPASAPSPAPAETPTRTATPTAIPAATPPATSLPTATRTTTATPATPKNPAVENSDRPTATAAPPPAPIAVPPPPPPFPPRDLELALTGSLERIEPAALVVACHRSHLTGRLVLLHGTLERSIFWEDGRIMGASSDAPEERLEALAYRRGLLTREQQRLLRTEQVAGTRRLAMLMLERSFIKPVELFPLVQDRVEEILFASLAASEGSYRILPEAVPDDERTASARTALALVTEAVRRKYGEERLLRLTGGPATVLRPRESHPPDLVEFGLTARETLLAEAIDGLRTVEDLFLDLGAEPLAGLQILYALVVGGRAEIAVRGLDAARPPEVDAAIDRARIAEKYEQIRNANYFDILGVTTRATSTEIQRAFERLSREFQTGGHPVASENRERLEEIQRVLSEARDVLADEGLREGYARHLGPSPGRG